MKHRRSIDLVGGVHLGYTVSEGSRRSGDIDIYPSLDRLLEWYVLLGWCPRCRRYGQLDRRDVRRVLGAAAILSDIAPRLLCTTCNERRGNKVSMKKLPR